MIEVYLYGRLRRHGLTGDAREPCVVRAEPAGEQRTAGDLVEALGISSAEVGSVFRDGKWQRDGLAAPISGARRLGLFPPEMGLLYV